MQAHVDNEEEHPLFHQMKENGSVEKLIELYEGSSWEEVKIIVGLIILNVDKGSEIRGRRESLVMFLKEKVKPSSNEWERYRTLVIFRRLIYCFFFVIILSFFFLLF
jgi:hypothetical protein